MRVHPLVLAGVLALGLIYLNHSLLLHVPMHEYDDYASNGLCIEYARSLRENYGGFSRMGFHHPGPAFFCVEALVQSLLYNHLRLVPCPLNAVYIASICLSCLFFAISIVTCARWMRHRLFLPIALFLSLAHFSSMGSHIMADPFPPGTFVQPFLCLLVTAAAVSCGGERELPWCVTAGGFLLHGHVEQPLFVVPVLTAALLLRRRSGAGALSQPTRLTVGALALLFLLPLLLDAARWPDCNHAAILKHLRMHGDEQHSWHRSIRYFCGFAGYGEFTVTWGLAWAVLVTLSAYWCGRQPQPFPLRLLAFAALASLLSIVWARNQHGRMFGYLALFNFAIYDVILLVFAAAAAQWLERLPRAGLGISLVFLVAVPLLQDRFLITDTKDPTMFELASSAMDRCLRRPSSIYLSFHAEQQVTAARLMLELQRRGVKYYLPGWARPWLGAQSQLVDAADALVHHQVEIWRLTATDGGMPLGEGMWLLTGCQALPDTGAIVFGEHGNQDAYLVDGWDSAVQDYERMISKQPSLSFRTFHTDEDISVEAEIYPLQEVGAQKLDVVFNGFRAGHYEIKQQTSFRCCLPARIWNRSDCGYLRLQFQEMPRQLALKRLQFHIGCDL